MSSDILSGPFSLSPLSETAIKWMLVCLTFQRSLRPHISSFFCSVALISTNVSSSSLTCSSVSFILYWFLLVYFYFSYCIVHLCFFFKVSSSLLNDSYIPSISASILFPRSWITFAIVTLNYFSSRLPILHCTYLFFWGFILFLYLEHISVLSHLSNFLWLWSLFPRLQNYNSWLVKLVQGLVQAPCWEILVPTHWWVVVGLV